jgi:microsomal prostaglandin-E synthase 1
MLDWLALASSRIFMVCCALIVLQMLVLAFATPLLRAKRNVWVNEEDAADFSGVVDRLEHADVARLVRAHRNQLENFAPFFATGWLWNASGASPALGACLSVAFTLARSAHVVSYLARKRRARTASHTVSFLVLVVLSCGVAWRALGL